MDHASNDRVVPLGTWRSSVRIVRRISRQSFVAVVREMRRPIRLCVADPAVDRGAFRFVRDYGAQQSDVSKQISSRCGLQHGARYHQSNCAPSS